MTRAVQKQIERSRQAKAGSKRVEVVLDAATKADLQAIMDRLNLKQSEAVTYAVRYVADIVTGRNDWS